MTWNSWLKALACLASMALALWMLVSLMSDAYDSGHAAAQADGSRALAELRQQYAEQSQAKAEKALADLQQEQARGDQLAASLATEKAQRRQTTDRLIGEIARVNDLYRTALDAPPAPLPACVFTTGFVRVWNEANGAAPVVPAQPAASGAADSSSGAGTPDDLAAAGIGRAEILTNHVRNAEKCSVVRRQLNLLIDWNTHGRD